MRFIQVGIGSMGRGWLQRLTGNPDAEVVALVDVDPTALASARAAGNYREEICFASLRDALKHVDADALICITPPVHHKQCVTQAMKAGLNVITEKPMADSLPDCISILRTSHDTERTCVVSQNYRYKPETQTLAHLVRSGQIGDIAQMKIDFYLGLDLGGRFHQGMEHPLLVDMSIHHFDLIRFVTGLNAVSVRGESWNPPWSSCRGDLSSALVFELENGAHIVYNASWSAKGQFCAWEGNWLIEGSKGSILYEKGQITIYKGQFSGERPRLYRVTKTEPVCIKNPERTGQEYVLNNFIHSLKRSLRPQTDVFDNIHSIAMVFAAIKAVKTGKRTPVLDRRLQKVIADYKPWLAEEAA